MKAGKWVPISKGLSFPHGRPFSEIEAAYSLQMDYDKNHSVTVAGYAGLWGWSRWKVRRFLEEMNVQLAYPHDCQKTRKKRGFIEIKAPTLTEHKPINKITLKRQKRLIDSKGISASTDNKIALNFHKPDKKTAPTRDPNPNPNHKTKNFTSDSDEIRLSILLFELIRENNPDHKQPDFQKWAKHIDLAIRLDGRTPADLEKVICWCQSDKFWFKNILSTEKLRKQFDSLKIQMFGNNGNAQKKNQAHESFGVSGGPIL